MRQPIRILLLMLLTVSVCLLPATFKLRQNHIRKEVKMRIKAGVDEKDLYSLSFAKNETIYWTKESKEFQWNQHLWDVVTKVVEGDSIHFRCLRDDQEKALFSGLLGIQNSDLEKNHSAFLTGFGQWAQLKYLPLKLEHTPLFQQAKEQELVDLKKYVLAMNDPAIDTPPPQC